MNLDSYLRTKGIAGADFAATISVSEGSLSRIRRGEQNVTRETIRRIVLATEGEVSAEELVFPVKHGLLDSATKRARSTGKINEKSGREKAA